VSDPSVTFFQVGNGNFTLIRVRDANIIVDINGTKEEKGAEGKTPLEMLRPFLPEEDGTLYLDVLCITHGDHDHCGGFAEFKEEMDAGRLVVGEVWHSNYDRTQVTEESELPEDYLALRAEILRRRGIENPGYGDVEVPLTAWQDETAAFSAVERPDGFSIKVLSPYYKDKGDEDWEVNDVSLVLNIEVLGLNILFPGDSSAKTWQERVIPYTLRKEGMEDWADAEILVAAHHGSYSFFGENREEVLNADPYPDNYEALDYGEPDFLLVLAEKRFPTSLDQSGARAPHYSAYKWYHKWFRENRGVSEGDEHPDQFKYTADGHLRLEYGDDGWEWRDDWSPDDDGGGKGFRYRRGPTRRGGDEYA
jgi:hypothetical protein